MLLQVTGKVKRPTGGYDDVIKETPVSGCRLYRRRPGFQRLEDRPAAGGDSPGITTLTEWVCSMPSGTAVVKGNTLRIPDGRILLVQDTRPYESGIQCDVE